MCSSDLEAGADVVLAARTASQLEETAQEVRATGRQALPIPTDVTRKDNVEKLMDAAIRTLGGLHILVNNAGINVNLGWRKVMNINLMAVMNGTMVAMERMVKAGKPCQIINTASTGTYFIFNIDI